MRGLSISTAWEETKAIIARDGRLFVSVALAMIVLPQTIAGLFAPRTEADVSPITWAILGLAIVISMAAQIALNRLAIGPSVTVGAAINRGFLRMPVLLAAFIMIVAVLIVVLILIGMILGAAGLITPPGAGQPPPRSLIVLLVLIWALIYAIFQLMIPIAAAEARGPFHLLSRSWSLGRHDYLRLLAFVFVVLLGLGVVWMTGQFVVGSFVMIALGQPNPLSLAALVQSFIIGLIQATYTVVAAAMLARIYAQLAGRSEAQAGVPSSGM